MISEMPKTKNAGGKTGRRSSRHWAAAAVAVCLMFGAAPWAPADILILKNGRVIKEAVIKESRDMLICETPNNRFFIKKTDVESIMRTGKTPLPDKFKIFITSLPWRMERFLKDYFALAAALAGLLATLAGLVVFKFLWVNIKAVVFAGADRRAIRRAIRDLDPEEKSVLREFFLQQANTLEMPVSDPAVSGLIHKGILETTRDQGEYSVSGLLLPVVVSSFAKRRIPPQAVGLPAGFKNVGDITDETLKDELARTRPRFMYDMASFYQGLETQQRNFR